MENKKTLVIVSILLVVLLGGASLLYAKLGDKLKPDNLYTQEDLPSPETQNKAPTATAAPNDSSDSVSGDNTTESSDNASGESPDTSENAYMAPDFTVYDRDGNKVHLSDFLGKPVILNFWASWCGPCKMEMPDFQEIYEEYGEDIHFVMVNLTDGAQETMKTATEFLDASGYTFPVYYDKDTDAAYTYQVYGIPVTYFINAEGHLIAQGSSALDAETIKRGIGMILE
ncbi:MAG: TlpA family protein disulfide reductase [Lachnospiraceae bacterium]|nr:TlpA family protein disulfide reductase [Lachnospiraceae bacterium]